MSADDQSKDEVERLIRETNSNSRELFKRASSYARSAQYVADLSDASEKVVTSAEARKLDWAPLAEPWRRLNEQQNRLLTNMQVLPTEVFMSSGSTAAYAMTGFANPNYIINIVSDDKKDEACSAAEKLGQVIDQSINKDDILALMDQFGLSSGILGKKSPTEQFRTAWAAFEQPVRENNPIITSLIPMRECIEDSIEALMRRRPTQEAAKSWEAKITSIGNQLVRNGITSADTSLWARHWAGPPKELGLVSRLSGAKHDILSREEWRAMLREATLFLQEVLQGLDPAKLR